MQLAIGDILEGKVTGITKFGAFVELGEGKTGMVHISEVSTDYVEDISQYLKKDQVVKVKVINITDEGKISLSIKKAMPRPQRPEQDKAAVSSYEWNPHRNENASFEDMLNKFKQTSDDKMSDLKKYRGEVKRGSANRRSRQD